MIESSAVTSITYPGQSELQTKGLLSHSLVLQCILNNLDYAAGEYTYLKRRVYNERVEMSGKRLLLIFQGMLENGDYVVLYL